MFNDTAESLKHTLYKHMNFSSWADDGTKILCKPRLENLPCKMVPQVSVCNACFCRRQSTNTCMEIFFTSQIFPCKNNSFVPVKTALSSLHKAKVRRKMLCFFHKTKKTEFPCISEKTLLFSCHIAQVNNYKPSYSFGLYITLASFKLVTSRSRIWPSFFSRYAQRKETESDEINSQLIQISVQALNPEHGLTNKQFLDNL